MDLIVDILDKKVAVIDDLWCRLASLEQDRGVGHPRAEQPKRKRASSTGMPVGGGFGCWSTTFKESHPEECSNLYASETVKKLGAVWQSFASDEKAGWKSVFDEKIAAWKAAKAARTA